MNLEAGTIIQLDYTPFVVTSFLGETGSIDDYSVFMPHRAAQEMLGLRGSVSLVDVGALCNNCPVEVISKQIMDIVPGVKASPVMQAVETRMKAVEQTASFSFLLAAIILVVGCAGVMNTMLASVHERLKEIGILMSLGADNRHLYKMFIWESAILGLIGGLIGIVVCFSLPRMRESRGASEYWIPAPKTLLQSQCYPRQVACSFSLGAPSS